VGIPGIGCIGGHGCFESGENCGVNRNGQRAGFECLFLSSAMTRKAQTTKSPSKSDTHIKTTQVASKKQAPKSKENQKKTNETPKPSLSTAARQKKEAAKAREEANEGEYFHHFLGHSLIYIKLYENVRLRCSRKRRLTKKMSTAIAKNA
jgi:hypothetical protein